MSKDRSAEKRFDEMLRKLREEVERWKKGKVEVYAWWEKPPVSREHEVEFIERWHEYAMPDPKAYVLLKLDGKEVKVERFTAEDWRERMEQEKREFLRTEYAWIDSIRVKDVVVDHLFGEKERGKVKIPHSLKKALVFYRLLWHFGPSYRLWSGDISGCDFLIKYKGYVFEISDDAESEDLIKIGAEVLVPRGVVWDSEAKEKYKPPRDICEEITAIVKFLTKYPVLHIHPVTNEYILD